MSSLHPYDACQVYSRNWSNDKYGSQSHFSYLSKQIPTRLYFVMCSSFRLQNITLFQGLSCLWQHNGARMIISLAWFHNLFLWDLCHYRGNWFKQTVLKYYITNSPGANPCFLPLIYQGLTRFGCNYLSSWFMMFFRNNYPSWKTSIVESYNFYCLVFSFENMCVEMEKYFPHSGRKSQSFYTFHS